MWHRLVSLMERLTGSTNHDAATELLLLADSVIGDLETRAERSPEHWDARLSRFQSCFLDVLEFFELRGSVAPGFAIGATPHHDAVASRSPEGGAVAQRLSLLRSLLIRTLLPGEVLAALKEDETSWCDSEHLPSQFLAKKAVERSAAFSEKHITSARPRSGLRPDLLQTFLSTNHDMVVLGDPGSGKSWGLALFTHQQFQRLADGAVPCWIPIYVSVSEIVKHPSEQNRQERDDPVLPWRVGTNGLPEFMVNALSRQRTLRWLSDQPEVCGWLVRAGAFLCIFDGFNEISLGERRLLAKQLGEFRNRYPHTRMILASRTRHWDGQGLGKFDCVVEVQPLDDAQVSDFVNQCFLAERPIQPQSGRDTDSPNEEQQRLARRRRSIHSHRLQNLLGIDADEAHPIAELRGNPFFLDKIIQIYQKRLDDRRYKGKNLLPLQRGDLFRDYVEQESDDRRWFSLQRWMLSVLGLHMTYMETRALTHGAENVLFVAFCIAPKDTLVGEGDSRLFELDDVKHVKGPTMARTPEQIAEDAKVSNGELLWECSARRRPLMRRFNCPKEEVVDKFRTLLGIICRNAFFETFDKESLFAHQSIQEYFAAERFGELYRQTASEYLDDSPSVPEYLRLRRYDEMLHIVLGCVFHSQQDALRTILRCMIVKGSRFVDLAECLPKAEYVDSDAAAMLRGMVGEFIEIPTAADEPRAAAVRCLPFLATPPEKGEELLRHGALDEGAHTWKSLLDLALEFRKGNVQGFPAMVEGAIAVRAQHARKNAQSRREELLVATSEWVRAGSHDFLNGFLVDQLVAGLDAEDPPIKFISAVWDGLKSGATFALSRQQWGLLLDSLNDPTLYSNVLTHPHDRRDTYLRDHFVDNDKMVAEIRRLAENEQGWEEPVCALLETQQSLGRDPGDLVRDVADVCRRNDSYPAPLLKAVWQLAPDSLCEADFDRQCLQWLAQQDPSDRPTGFGGWVGASIRGARRPVQRVFARDLEMLAALAITPNSTIADPLVAAISSIVEASSYKSSTPFDRFLRVDTTTLLVSFDGWGDADVFQRNALLVSVRKRREELDDDALFEFWQGDPAERFFFLLYVGGGSDQFVRSRPDKIRDVIRTARWAHDPKGLRTVKENGEYIASLQSQATEYSTKVTLFRNLGGTQCQHLFAQHPGHPAPTPGSRAFAGFRRLLEYGMTDEAAYYLNTNESTWDAVEQCLREQALPLLGRFTQAKYHSQRFSTYRQSERAGRVRDEELRARAGLGQLLAHPDWLRPEQISLLLKTLIAEGDDGLSVKRLQVLDRASVWRQSEVPGGPYPRDQITLALQLRVFDEELQNGLEACAATSHFAVNGGLAETDIHLCDIFSRAVSAAPSFVGHGIPADWLGLLEHIRNLRVLERDLAEADPEQVVATVRRARRYKGVLQAAQIQDKKRLAALAAVCVERLGDVLEAEEAEAVLAWISSHCAKSVDWTQASIEELLRGIQERGFVPEEHLESIRDRMSREGEPFVAEVRAFLAHEGRNDFKLLRGKTPLEVDGVVFSGDYQDLLGELQPVFSALSKREPIKTFEELAEGIRSQTAWECGGFVEVSRVVELLQSLGRRVAEEAASIQLQMGSQMQGVTPEVVGKAAAALADDWPKHFRCRSVADCRGVFFWQVRSEEPDWMSEDRVKDLSELCGKLPSDLHHSLVYELIRSIAHRPNHPSPDWWPHFVFETVAGAEGTTVEIGDEEYGKFVEAALDSRRSGTGRQDREAVVKAVCVITTGKHVSRLKSYIEKALVKSGGQCRELNETIDGIVQGVDVKTGEKVFIHVELFKTQVR